MLKFKPSVGQLMDLCGENYRLFSKMAPELASMQGKYISSKSTQADLHMEIIEQSPYTTLIHLTYFFNQSNEKADPNATLRIYHDSKQLEVIHLKQKSLPIVRMFNFPGLILKWRANVFISKWLKYCLHQGHLFDKNNIKETTPPKVPTAC